MTVADRELPWTSVPSGSVRPASKTNGLPTEIRRRASFNQSLSPSKSSRRANHSTNCLQNRLYDPAEPSIAHLHVESTAKTSTRPNPYSRATKSGSPVSVAANVFATGKSRGKRFAPSSVGKPFQASSDSSLVWPRRRIETPPNCSSGTILMGPFTWRSFRMGSSKRWRERGSRA